MRILVSFFFLCIFTFFCSGSTLDNSSIRKNFSGLEMDDRIQADAEKLVNDTISPTEVVVPITANISDSVSLSVENEQEPVRDTIEIIKAGVGYKYKFKDQLLTLNSLGELIGQNTDAAAYFNKAKGTSGFTSVLGYAGGFLIGYPIGTALGGGKPMWGLVAVGCGLVAIVIPIASSADRNLLRAVRAYNEGKPVAKVQPYDIKLGVNKNGLALAISF
jgi:hypothetical protein